MFLVMVAVMPFISCSSDDDNSGDQATIIGKWRESKETVKSYEDGELMDTKVTESSTNEYVEMEFRADNIFTEFISEAFLSNGDSGEEVVETSSYEGTYEVKADKLIYTYPPSEESDVAGSYEWQYSVSGNTLTTITVEETATNDIMYKEETTVEYYKL